MRLSSIRASLLAAFGLGLTVAGHAEPINVDMLRHMAPQQAHAWAMQHQKRQQAQQMTSKATAAVDTTAPALTAFDVPVTIDVGIPTNPAFAPIKATDDMSGVYYGYGYAVGPSGQTVNASFSDVLPSKKFSGGMSIYGVSAFSEPGTYTFVSLYVYDLAGNMTYLDQGALAALGRTSFVVKNKRGYDTKAPQLQHGQILTPQLSLSATVPGTTHARYASVQADSVDLGGTVVSGIASVTMDFCTLDQTSCFGVWGGDSRGARRDEPMSLRLGGELNSAMAPGEYHLRTVAVYDYAGNSQYLYGTEFGGWTDFSQYFASTTIVLTP